MSAQLEQDLRSALAAQADELPPDASAALVAGDYRPRAAFTRPVLAMAATVLTAAAFLAVALLGGGNETPRAFAGWTAAPTASTSGQRNTARTSCRAGLTRMDRFSRPGRPAIALAAWHTVLVDTRGPYTLTLLEAGQGRATAVCFTGSRGGSSIGAAIGVLAPAPVPRGHVTYDSSGGGVTSREEGSREFSNVVGRTGPGVTGVTVRLNNGTRVTASRAGGWFLAWWPGSHGIRATEVTTSAGTTAQ